MPLTMLRAQGIVMRYGPRTAVCEVDLDLHPGEILGLLGPNGAGKTTTLEIIEGLREPDGGEVTVLGLRPWPRNPALLPRIGVQLQATSFFERLTAREQLRTFADLYRVPIGASPVKGPATAKVTIVEFSEFQCPFCSRVGPTVEQMLKDYEGKIRVCFKHNPLPFHNNAIGAATAYGPTSRLSMRHSQFANAAPTPMSSGASRRSRIASIHFSCLGTPMPTHTTSGWQPLISSTIAASSSGCSWTRRKKRPSGKAVAADEASKRLNPDPEKIK